jgi:hypothetical protein
VDNQTKMDQVAIGAQVKAFVCNDRYASTIQRVVPFGKKKEDSRVTGNDAPHLRSIQLPPRESQDASVWANPQVGTSWGHSSSSTPSAYHRET